MSICTLSNRALGVTKVDRGVAVCRWIFDCWHLTQVLVYSRTSLLIPGQTYLDVTRCCVARIPGCEREWSCSKTLRQNLAGTTGRRVPVDASHDSMVEEPGREMSLRSNEVAVDRRSANSGSSRLAIAICSKSIAGVGD